MKTPSTPPSTAASGSNSPLEMPIAPTNSVASLAGLAGNMRWVVVTNSLSGTADSNSAWQELAATSANVTWIRLDEVDDLRTALRDACQSARAHEQIRFIAAGGDGTVHAVVQHAAECSRHCEYAVIPTGTGNDFARSLGMPLRGMAAWQIATHADAHPLDVMDCLWNGDSSLATNMITAGNTGAFLQGMTPEVKERWGPFCYLRGVLDVATNLQSFHARIEVDGDDLGDVEFLNLFIANGRTSGGGLTVAPRSRLDDGLLDLMIVKDGTPPDIAGLVGQYALGDFLEHPLIVFRTARRVVIRSSEPLPCTVDGEVFTTEELNVSLRAGSVSIVAPAMGPSRGSAQVFEAVAD